VPASTPQLALNTLNFSPEANCSLGTDTIIARSESANRMTMIYRANYASVGMWQLYGRNITLSSDGTIAFAGDPVNLFPGECYGNTSGVTSFSITGFADGSSSTQAYDINDAHNVAALAIQMTCYSSVLSGSATFNLSDFSRVTTSTKTFLKDQGVVGYWRGKNVYVKSNGTTMNPDGTAGSATITWTGFTSISKVYGTDKAGGIYLSGGSTYKYVDSTFAVSTSTVVNALTDWTAANFSTSGAYHSQYGLYVTEAAPKLGGVQRNYLSLINNNTVVTSAPITFGDHILAVINDKALFYNDKNTYLSSDNFSSYSASYNGVQVYTYNDCSIWYSGCDLYQTYSDSGKGAYAQNHKSLKSVTFSNGTQSTVKSNWTHSSVNTKPIGLYGNKALFMDSVSCVLYMTDNYF
jgi:hypothetical protein